MTGKSGHNSGSFLLSRVPPGKSRKDFFSTYVVTDADAAVLRQAAQEDARRYIYNGLASFLGGLTGLKDQSAAWTVTKMYYAAFYVGRAALCRAGLVIFHSRKDFGDGHTQYELRTLAGSRPTVVDKPPSTHKLVARRFADAGYPTFMKGLRLDNLDPILWLMDQREYWQYRAGRFPDPEIPTVLSGMDTGRASQLLAAYAKDTTGVYLADTTHALLSLPFRLITWSLSQGGLRSPGVIDDGDLLHLKRRCRVGGQMLSAIGNQLA